CTHFRPLSSGLSSTGALQSGHTRISSRSLLMAMFTGLQCNRIGGSPASKREAQLQLDVPVVCLGSAPSRRELVRDQEVGRRNRAARGGRVIGVQQVAGLRADCDVVAMGGRCVSERTAVMMPPTASGAPALESSAPAAFGFRAEAEGLANSQVQRKEAGAVSVISGKDRLAGRWVRIEKAVRSGDDSGLVRVCRDAGTAGEQSVTVLIGAGRDVQRRARVINKERAKTEIPFRVERAGEKDEMMLVDCRRTVVRAHVVLIRRECTRAVGIAQGICIAVTAE